MRIVHKTLCRLALLNQRHSKLNEYICMKCNVEPKRQNKAEPPYKIKTGLSPETQYNTIYNSSYSRSNRTNLPDNTLNHREFCGYRKY